MAPRMPTDLQASPPVAVDPRLVLPFIKAVCRMLASMRGLDVTTGRPSMKTELSSAYDVSACIAFTGDLCGAMALGLSEPVALALVEAFLGTRPHPESTDFKDAIGEFANMIAGQAKCELGLRAGIGLPTSAIGPKCQLTPTPRLPCVVIPCETAAGTFWVEIAIKQVA